MSIFTFLADEISEQANQCGRQAQQCQQTVSNIRQGSSSIVSFQSWTGQGAQSFVRQLMTKLIPQTMELIAAISGFGGSITKALDIMTQADKVVDGIAGQMSDIFDQVF